MVVSLGCEKLQPAQMLPAAVSHSVECALRHPFAG